MQKNSTLLIILMLLVYTTAFAQVGVGTINPHASAQLDVSASDKGVLVPRLSTTQRDAITNPATGLLIYNTDNHVFYYYNGSRWLSLLNSSDVADSAFYIAGTNTPPTSHLISLINMQVLLDSAGIVYDTGGDLFNYNNNENYTFSLTGNNDVIGYRFIINYDIAAGDSLLIKDVVNNETIALITNDTGNDTILSHQKHLTIIFKSNSSVTAPGFILQFNQIYDAGAPGTRPSFTGPWYYRPATHAVAGGLNVIPDSLLEMGYNSISYGQGNFASGPYSAAFGYNSHASGIGTFATGNSTSAYARWSYASGIATNADGDYAFATGASTNAAGFFSAAFGSQTTAFGEGSFSAGDNTIARGQYAASFGYHTIAKPYASVVLGRYNDTASISSIGWYTNDALLIVGNGSSATNRSNAMTLFKNGDITLSGTFTQNSDARLKTNIKQLNNAMYKLNLINGYQYNWATPYSDKNKLNTGLIAQEIEQVIPELVRKDGSGSLSVNYYGLIPYLLEGIKSMQTEIEHLKIAIQTLKEKNQ